MTGQSDDPPRIKLMRLRREGVCACGAVVSAGTEAGWDRVDRMVVCADCLAASVADVGAALERSPSAKTSMPGASLRREYERRRQARETRTRQRHKYLGGLILALSDDPAWTRAFASGALGEERLAARLERDCGESVLFLHNRSLGSGRRDGDIDHLAIAQSGIHLIDAKRYPGAKVRIARSGGFFSTSQARLMVGGRDRTRLLDGAEKQAAGVFAALEGHPLAAIVSVSSYLCFMESDLPLFGTLETRGVRILGPKAAVRALLQPGDLDAGARASLREHLAAALPPA